MMEKTLFVSDLDGTLLNADSAVSLQSVSLLNEAIARGALFTVATARTPSTVESLLSEVDCNLPFIVMTGAAIWNPVTKTFSHSVCIPEAEADKILAIIRRHSLPAFIYILRDNRIHIYHTGPLSDLEREFITARADSPVKVFHIPESGESILPSPLTGVSLFYSMQPSDIVEAAYREIKENVDCNPIFYHDIFGPTIGIMEVFSAKASKANAIATLKEITGASRVVAFGDNVNDLPMLRCADVAVAVENAVGAVKEAADTLIGPNTADSVARFISQTLG